MADNGRAIERCVIDKHPPLPWECWPTGGGSSRALLAWAGGYHYNPTTQQLILRDTHTLSKDVTTLSTMRIASGSEMTAAS
jgi:hypothetical protein